MSQLVKILGASAMLSAQSARLLESVRSLRASGVKGEELRAVARVTRDYGASRPVMELSSALEALQGVSDDTSVSIESLDVIPARKSDSRTVSIVDACEHALSTESASLSTWMIETSPKLSALYEAAYENLSGMADAADALAASLEGQLIDPVVLQATPYFGMGSSSVTKSLESASALAENLSNLDDASIGTESYQSACLAGFESFAGSDVLKSRGLELKDGALEHVGPSAEAVNGTLADANFNAPDAVSALRAGAKACRALEAMLENRVVMASCLEYGASSVPAAESIDGVSEEGLSLKGARTLVGNYTTLTSQLIAGVVENLTAALTAGDALKALV